MIRQNKYEYDAFISHAVEDKIPIANELCARLEKAGLKIWYSGKELGIGDSIEKTIQKGLNRSRYGIVIFSPTYLAKNWTIREFYTLLAKEIEEHKVILPVLYNVSLDDLKNKDLVMADRFAVNADRGIDFVVQRLVQEIQKSPVMKTETSWYARLWFFLVLSLLANVGLLLKSNLFSQTSQNVSQVAAFRGDHPRIIHNERSFFDQMATAFERVNACQCTPANLQPPPPEVYNAGFYNQQPTENEQASPVPIRENPRPRKMTMALVFQLETAAESSPDVVREMDQMMKTVSLESNADQMFTSVNLVKHDDARPGRCSHALCATK
jgi:hypothetical protein